MGSGGQGEPNWGGGITLQLNGKVWEGPHNQLWLGCFQGGPPLLGISLLPCTQLCCGYKPGIGVHKATDGAVPALKGKGEFPSLCLSFPISKLGTARIPTSAVVGRT